MARMIPNRLEDDHGSFGERRVFEALKDKLEDDFIVFHSVRWNARNERDTIIWGECDFTIFHPTYGMIVLEVKSGGIECTNNRWTYVRTDNGKKYRMKCGPLEQCDREIRYKFKNLVNELLDRSSEDDRQYCLVEPAAWFPSIGKRDIVGELPMEYRDEIVLYENALDNPKKFIMGIYDYYDGRKHTRLNSNSCKKIVDAFAPYFSAVPSLKSRRQERNEEFVRLTRQQNYLLDYLEEQRVAAIQGAAGTGKTMLAVEKANRLAKSGKVLFLCFNRYLKEHLQGLKEDEPGRYTDIDFYNLPQLACAVMKVSSVEKDDMIYFLSNFENYDWSYNHIVIDEGQDFDSDSISKLYDIALLQDGAFYVFYDKKQFVQGDEFPDWLVNAECRLVLNINCRNTYQIADTAGRPVDIQPRVKERSVEGDMPSFYLCKDAKEALKTLSKSIDKYRAANYSYEQICVLTLKTENSSILKDIDKIGNHQIRKEMEGEGVLFTTVRKFKGLEADAIIIIDMDGNTFTNDESKRLFYVGCSRAKHQLDIVFVGSEDALKNAGKGLTDQIFPNAKIGIARCLNVKPVQI